jgi:hypothetical protein
MGILSRTSPISMGLHPAAPRAMATIMIVMDVPRFDRSITHRMLPSN